MELGYKYKEYQAFAKWAFEVACEGAHLDGGDIQEELARLGIIEEITVNPEENEFGTDTLFSWIESHSEHPTPANGGSDE